MNINVGIDKLRELDRIRLNRKKKAALTIASSPYVTTPTKSNTKKKPSVQISEHSIRHKENVKYLIPNSPYFSYSMADVYLHLLITLISNNSVLSMSAIRSLWG